MWLPNILRTSGFMKKAKYLASSTQRAQPVILISETGVISREVLPMETGYVSAPGLRMSWLVLHGRKLRCRNKHGMLEDDPTLLLSERNYLPLDFIGESKKKKESIVPLTEVAKIKHAEARASAGDNSSASARDRMLVAVANGGMVLIGLMALLFFAIRMWGNG